jgi:hypothetical protein
MSIEVGTEQPAPICVSPPSAVAIFQKRVMLTMPWMKVTNPITAFCVQQLADKRRTASMLNFGDSFVAHARNKCADIFLQSDSEWMLTIDDDMLVPFGNGTWFNAHLGQEIPEPFSKFNALDRLLSHGHTLVGALYYGRWKGGWPVYAEGRAEEEYARKAPYDVVKPTRWVGTGCMLIHRSVFEDIEKKFPYLGRNGRGKDAQGGNWFSTSEHTVMDEVRRTHQMLSTGPMTGEKAMRALEMLDSVLANAKSKSSLGMGEDAQFCIRAKEAGHQPYVDMGLICGHIGYTCFGPGDVAKPKLKSL